MAHPGFQKSGGQKGQAIALVVIRICVGTYLFFLGLHKLPWLLDAKPLSDRLALWLVDATPASRWYLERMMPGVPVFARLVPIAEMAGGLALVLGFWTRVAAGLSLLMILNFQIAAAEIFKFTYLTNPNGLPLVGALLGLVVGGRRLPLSLRN
jgi:uncharacterized membrane protein YphA (DoxX/SURF4 family)